MSENSKNHNQVRNNNQGRQPIFSARRKIAALALSGATAGLAIGTGVPQRMVGEVLASSQASAATAEAKPGKAPKVPTEITVDGVTMKVYNPKSKEALRDPEAYQAEFEPYAQGDPKHPYKDVNGKVIPTAESLGDLGNLYARKHGLDGQDPGVSAIMQQTLIDHGDEYIQVAEVVFLDRNPKQN